MKGHTECASQILWDKYQTSTNLDLFFSFFFFSIFCLRSIYNNSLFEVEKLLFLPPQSFLSSEKVKQTIEQLGYYDD